jgi:hypothetical protein
MANVQVVERAVWDERSDSVGHIGEANWTARGGGDMGLEVWSEAALPLKLATVNINVAGANSVIFQMYLCLRAKRGACMIYSRSGHRVQSC